MARLIGTAGHIDHGKTTLIRALTGIDADRLPEEKARGMTIDIGFAYLDLPKHRRVSIVDVPGHEKFIRNMLVGALGIDVALLCVAADESVMQQTREHFQIVTLLPVQRLVAALTRSDLVDTETLALTRAEVEELLRGTRFEGSPILPVSAVVGTGLPELREALSGALDVSDDRSKKPWYLPIDRAFSVKGHGCVVTGTLAQGEVRVGEQAVIEPGRLEARVRAIHSHGDSLEESEGGRRTALNLSGVRVEDLRRGMAIGAPGALFESSLVDAAVTWLEGPRHGERVRVSIGAEEAIARLHIGKAGGEVCQLRLESPVACAMDQPLIIRRYSPPLLLGGGRVAVPLAKPRRVGEAATIISADDEGAALLQAIGDSADGTPTEEVCRVLGKSPQALGDLFERLSKEGAIKGFGGLWFRSEAFESAASRLLAALDTLHAANPTQAYMQRERALAEAKLKWSGKALDRIISALAAEGRIEASGTAIKDAKYKVQLTARQREFLDRVIAELSKQPVNTPSPSEIARELVTPPQAVEEILRIGQQAGEVVAIGQGVFYTPAQIEQLKERLRKMAAGKTFPASAARDALGTTRKYAIPILEYFDLIRFTTRVGDLRAIN